MLGNVESGVQSGSRLKGMGQKAVNGVAWGAGASVGFFGTRWICKKIAGAIAGASYDASEEEEESELEETITEIKKKQKISGT